MWEIPLFTEEKLFIPYLEGTEQGINYLLGELRHFPPYSVTVIPFGCFWGGFGGTVMDRNNKILKELSHEVPQSSIFPANFKPTILPQIENKTVAVLNSFFGFNYYHWMFDVAARLYLIRKSNITIDLYITSCPFPFQDEILTLLGIPPEKRINIMPYLFIQANKLVIPSFIHSYKGIMPGWSVHFLREELYLKRDVKKRAGYERIYISRARAQHRKMINEDEVMNLLEQHGFKCIFLEDESVLDKIEIFHSAEMIIAPHGAGLTNLLFCNPGTKIIELFHPGWIFPCYRFISFYAGLDYHCLPGEGEHIYRMDLRNASKDIVVDIHRLSNLLASL